jgi:hypothetical protein
MMLETHESQGNTENYGGGVFVWGGKACEKAPMSTQRSLLQRKTVGGLEKVLANQWSWRKIRKRSTLVWARSQMGNPN